MKMKLIITRKVLSLVAVDENREKNSDTSSSFLDTFRQSIRLSTISRFSFSINAPLLKKCPHFKLFPDPSTTQVRSRKVQQFELAFDDEAVSEGQVRQYFPETWIFEEDTVG